MQIMRLSRFRVIFYDLTRFLCGRSRRGDREIKTRDGKESLLNSRRI